MKTHIPAVIESYFRASNANDIDALVGCFCPDATVADEARTYRGVGEIKAWSVAVRKKYEFQSEILEAAGNGAGTMVTAKVTGSFPGSPVELNFRFALEGSRIAGLEIG